MPEKNQYQNIEYYSADNIAIMGQNGQEARKRLFDIYAANLSEAVPGIYDTFRCPICLRDFDRSALDIDQMLTRGHIIPDALDGRLYTLECGNCNHSFGHAYEAHAAREKIFRDWVNGVEGIKKLVHINDGVSDTAAYVSRGPKQEFLIYPTDSDDPNYKEHSERMITRQFKTSFTMHINAKYIPERVNLSLIHSAFLMMFYCFGYEYVLSSIADPVRKVIRGEKAPLSPQQMVCAMNINTEVPLPAVGVIR